MNRVANDLLAVALLLGIVAAFFFLLVVPSATILHFVRHLVGG